MYIVNDTVEEYIYDLSVKRRLAHIQHGPAASSSAPLGSDDVEIVDGEGGEEQQQDTANGEIVDEQQQLPPVEEKEKGDIKDDEVEEANSLELQIAAPLKKLMLKGQGGGERVDEGDLWACLFNDGRNVGRRRGSIGVREAQLGGNPEGSVRVEDGLSDEMDVDRDGGM